MGRFRISQEFSLFKSMEGKDFWEIVQFVPIPAFDTTSGTEWPCFLSSFRLPTPGCTRLEQLANHSTQLHGAAKLEKLATLFLKGHLNLFTYVSPRPVGTSGLTIINIKKFRCCFEISNGIRRDQG